MQNIRDSWWLSEKGHVHHNLGAYIDSLLAHNNRRFVDYVRFAGLYGNWEAAPAMGSFLATTATGGRFYKRISFNLTQSMVDTVCNTRASEYGRLQATSLDGDYKQFMMAKQLTMALRSEFQRNNVESKFYTVCRDALTFGNGLWTVEKVGGGDTGEPLRPRIVRQFTPEVVADPFDNTVDGFPYSFNIVRFVSRAALAAKFTKYADVIMRAAVEPGYYQRVRGDDNIRVDEAWTVTRNGVKGRHVVCVTGADLLDEEYDHTEPPFVNISWNPSFQGWYAQGLVDQLMGLQMKLNELLEIISEAHSLFAHPTLLVEQNSNFNTEVFQDVPGKMLKYLTTKPEILKAEMISPEVYAHLERIYQKAYEIAGISPYVAGAKTMGRLESSKAQNSMQDMNDKRHFSFARRCEEGTEKLARLFCRVAAECDAENGYATKLPHSKYFPSISWSKIDYEVDKFNIEIGSVNPLMGKTSEKLQEVQDSLQLGSLTPTQFRQYLDNPDIQRAARRATASDDYIDWAIDQMTIEMVPLQPDEFMDKKTAFSVCVEHWLIGERLGWHDDRARDNLLSYILALKDQLAPTQPAPPPGAQPMASPGTTPPTASLAAGLPNGGQAPAPQVNVTNNNTQNGPPAGGQ